MSHLTQPRRLQSIYHVYSVSIRIHPIISLNNLFFRSAFPMLLFGSYKICWKTKTKNEAVLTNYSYVERTNGLEISTVVCDNILKLTYLFVFFYDISDIVPLDDKKLSLFLQRHIHTYKVRSSILIKAIYNRLVLKICFHFLKFLY